MLRYGNKVFDSWFDVKMMSVINPDGYVMPQVFAALKEVCDLVNLEAKTQYKGDYSRIILSGFSLGACLAQCIYLLSIV